VDAAPVTEAVLFGPTVAAAPAPAPAELTLPYVEAAPDPEPAPADSEVTSPVPEAPLTMADPAVELLDPVNPDDYTLLLVDEEATPLVELAIAYEFPLVVDPALEVPLLALVVPCPLELLKDYEAFPTVEAAEPEVLAVLVLDPVPV